MQLRQPKNVVKVTQLFVQEISNDPPTELLVSKGPCTQRHEP